MAAMFRVVTRRHLDRWRADLMHGEWRRPVLLDFEVEPMESGVADLLRELAADLEDGD